MPPFKPSDDSWQEVKYGKQKKRGPSQASSRGALHAVPNGRIMPSRIANHQAPAPKKKEKIPYELKNAREWDEEKRKQYESSSESSEDEDEYQDPELVAYQQPSGNVAGIVNEGSTRKFGQQSEPKARPPSQLPTRPKSHPRSEIPPPFQGPRVKFNYKEDNLARAAFRKRLDPNGKFVLPKDCHDLEPNQKRMYDTFDEIGVRLGSFIRPPQHVQDHEVLIWGDARQVRNTIDELTRWLSDRLDGGSARKPTGKDNFAREISTIGNEYHRMKKKMQKEAKILEFQQAPAADRIFPCQGTFLWPVDEVRPQDILGPSLEALDPLRIQYHCHILFDEKLSSFRIFSDQEDATKKTIDRLVGTMREYVAKNVRPDHIILIESPVSSTARKNVEVLKVAGSMIPVLTGDLLDAKPQREWPHKSMELRTQNNRRIERSLENCIANLPHYRGLVRIRVHFGTFALEKFRWKAGAVSVPLEDFTDDVRMPGTKAGMIGDLQIKKDATTIMTQIQGAADLLVPLDNCITSLEEVVPSFSASFTFENPNSPPMNFVLELTSSPAAPTVYEKVQALWTRTDRRDNTVPLEAFMARLESGVSWKLQVSTENSIDPSRINPRMTDFADGVQLSKIPRTRTELTGQKVFTWKKDYPGIMQPSTFQQKTTLRYRLAHHPEWELEIARYDSYSSTKNVNVPVETKWSATLYNINWDSALAVNSTLSIGEAADWDPRLETFFPSNSNAAGKGRVEEIAPGVAEFLEVVARVSQFIDGIKQELPRPRG